MRPAPLPPLFSRAVRHVLSEPGLFVNSSSDFRLLGEVLAAADGHGEVPTAEELEADSESLDMAALFDGGDLERI